MQVLTKSRGELSAVITRLRVGEACETGREVKEMHPYPAILWIVNVREIENKKTLKHILVVNIFSKSATFWKI